MGNPKPICEWCGESAVVHVRFEEGGTPLVRHYCLRCADLEDRRHEQPERRLNVPLILIVVGMLVLALSVFADTLAFGDVSGFGWQQRVGVAVAVVLVLFGALMRIPTLMALGLLTGGVTVLADLLGFGSAPGFGWQQMAGTALGAGSIVIGLVVARSMSLNRP